MYNKILDYRVRLESIDSPLVGQHRICAICLYFQSSYFRLSKPKIATLTSFILSLNVKSFCVSIIENVVLTQVRGARLVTDKMQDIFGGLFSRTELSEVLTEIVKMDPNFCKEQFLKDCERDIIPNILEAMIRGDLDILQDW